jgi:hypothetical protein
LCQATLESLPDRPLANYPLRVKGIETTALIDTGAEGNFIDEKFVKRHRLQYQRLSKPYRLNTVEGTQKTRVLYETLPLEIEIEKEKNYVTFDIVLITKDVILGDPWLREHNPRINFREQRIEGWRRKQPRKWENWNGNFDNEIEGQVMIAWIRQAKEPEKALLPKEYQRFTELAKKPDKHNALLIHQT